MIQNAFKKVKDGEATGGEEGTGNSEVKEGKKKTATPGSRKKKVKAEGAEQDEEERVWGGQRKREGEWEKARHDQRRYASGMEGWWLRQQKGRQ